MPPPTWTNDPTPYRERAGLEPTRRAPAARLDLAAGAIERYPLAPPLPQPDVVRDAARPEDPDVAATAPWPPAAAG